MRLTAPGNRTPLITMDKNLKDISIYVLSASIIIASIIIKTAIDDQASATCFSKAYEAVTKEYPKTKKEALVVYARRLCN